MEDGAWMDEDGGRWKMGNGEWEMVVTGLALNPCPKPLPFSLAGMN